MSHANWRKDARNAAIEHARLYGCTCDVEVTVGGSRRTPTIEIRHDDWCPVLQTKGDHRIVIVNADARG